MGKSLRQLRTGPVAEQALNNLQFYHDGDAYGWVARSAAGASCSSLLNTGWQHYLCLLDCRPQARYPSTTANQQQHVLHLAYWFQIFQTFNASFICAHSADAPEVPHFFRTFAQAPGLFFSDIWTLPGHVLHLAYLFWIFQTLSTSFICACSRSSTFFQEIYSSTRAVFFGYSGHS